MDAVPERQVVVDLALDVEASASGKWRSSRLPAAVSSTITLPAALCLPVVLDVVLDVARLHR